MLDITWLADANLAASNTFGVKGISANANGRMTWSRANEWIAAMNTANYLGYGDWRLPNVIDTGVPGCDFALTGTDCGWNVDLSTGEMAHLYYSTLGNLGYYTSGSLTGGACLVAPNYCLTNPGPFSNLQPPNLYWSGASYAPAPAKAWAFGFGGGSQGAYDVNSDYRAWAVRSGDVVPVPGAVWLLGSALGVLGALRRKLR